MKATPETPMLELALDYAARGIPVFPCREVDSEEGSAKQPYTSNGFRGATTRENIIRRWWKDHPNAAVGMPTGRASGIWVLDIDIKPDVDGLEAVRRLEQEHSPLPETRTVMTPSGGQHMLFKYVDGIGNRGRFDRGLDVRGEGGYILAPGSAMADGSRYEPLDGFEPTDAPEWLIKIVKAPATSHAPAGNYTPGNNDSYVEAAVSAELGELASTRGGRNNALNDSAFKIGTLVGAGGISRAEAEERLFAAAVANGYVSKDGERAARQTIKSGLDRGTQKPREIPEAESDDGLAERGAYLASGLLKRLVSGHLSTRVSSATNTDEAESEEPEPEEDDGIIRATPYQWVDPSKIPPREFLFGDHLIRKCVSVTVAPGGVGKSSLTIAEGLSMVTGKPIFNPKLHKKLRVWLWNGEDPRDELQRRIQAACIRFNISPEQIGDRLFVDTGRERGIVVARDDKRGVVIARPVVEQVVKTILDNQIDVLVIDPFVSTHEVSENDNTAINMVAKLWVSIADETNIAIDLIHHVRKAEGRDLTVDDSRGAGALLAAARSARVLNRMTEEQAKAADISADERLGIFNVQVGKANLTAMRASGEWRRIESVGLGNGISKFQGQDHAGVVTPWSWPTAEDRLESLTDHQIQAVMAIVKGRDCRESYQSPEWLGYEIAPVFEMELPVSRAKKMTPEHRKISKIIDAMVGGGYLKVEQDSDPSKPSSKVKFYRAAR